MGTTAEKGQRVLQSIAEVQEGINNLGGNLTDQTPFKNFRAELDNIYNNFPKTDYAEGSNITLSNTLKGKLDFEDGIVGYGDTQQEGTPTPDNPQDIEVVRGKNVANLILGKVPSVNNGELVDSIYGGYVDYIETYGNDYTISHSVTTNKPYIFFYGDNHTYLGNVQGVDSGYKISSSTYFSNTKYIRLRTDNYNDLVNNLQIEKGSQATSYLPYNTLEVVERGKNLFNPDITGLFKLGCSVSESNGEITITATQNGDIYVGNVTGVGSTYVAERGKKIYVKPNTRYTIVSTNNNVNKILFTEFDSNNISLGYAQANTLTTKANTSYITVRYGLENAVNGTSYKTKIMVAEGTDTTYEPYQTPQTYQLSLGDKELYTDSKIVRVSKNNFKFVDKWKKIFIDSNDIASVSKGCGIIHNKYFIDVADVGINSYNTIPPILSNIDKSEKWSYINDNDDLGGKMFLLKLAESQNQFRLYLNATTVQEAKTNLDNSNAYFIYKAITPIETPITDTTLINQLEEWYNSHSLNGTTIIEIDGQLPLIIKVRALKGE